MQDVKARHLAKQAAKAALQQGGYEAGHTEGAVMYRLGGDARDHTNRAARSCRHRRSRMSSKYPRCRNISCPCLLAHDRSVACR